MNGNIVAVVLPDLDPVHQLGNYQMLGFIAGIVKVASPAQNLFHLDFVGLLVVLLHFQQDFGLFLLLCGCVQPSFLLQEHGVDNAEVKLVLAGEGFQGFSLQGINLSLRVVEFRNGLLVVHLRDFHFPDSRQCDQIFPGDDADPVQVIPHCDFHGFVDRVHLVGAGAFAACWRGDPPITAVEVPVIDLLCAISQFTVRFVMRIAKAVSAVPAEDQPGQEVPGALLDRLDRLFRSLGCPALHQRFAAVKFLIADDPETLYRWRKLITEPQNAFVDRIGDDRPYTGAAPQGGSPFGLDTLLVQVSSYLVGAVPLDRNEPEDIPDYCGLFLIYEMPLV